MSEKSFPFVSIIIPVFNEERYLSSCLTSLKAISYSKDRHEIILVDNGSTDKTLEIARSFNGIHIYIKEDVKVGAVRNYGVTKAKGSVIVFLDSDCVVSPNWLNSGVALLESQPNTVFGGRYLLRDDPSWLEKYWVLGSAEQSINTVLVGGCIFIAKDTFSGVGGFDGYLNAGEDVELTERLITSNFTVKIDSSLSVIHLGYPSRLKPFVKRQLWHSSDYVNRLPHSLNDKVFLLTILFMVSIIGALSSLIFLRSSVPLLVFFVLLIILCPAVLSAKRIIRSGKKYTNILDYISIYLVDCLYLIGRTLGVMSGIRNRFTFKQNVKVSRR